MTESCGDRPDLNWYLGEEDMVVSGVVAVVAVFGRSFEPLDPPETILS
jgi:hypothetical protein